MFILILPTSLMLICFVVVVVAVVSVCEIRSTASEVQFWFLI